MQDRHGGAARGHHPGYFLLAVRAGLPIALIG